MKIALIAPFEEVIPPKKYGGTELVVSNLAEQLVELGHDVTLFASAGSKTSARLITCTPKALRSIKEAANPRVNSAYVTSGLVKILSVLQNESFDIIHNHMGWPFFALNVSLTAPILTTVHNSLKPEYERAEEERYMYAKYKDMPLISLSRAQKRSAPTLNFIDTVYNGIDVEKFTFSPHSGKYLAFLGRLSPEKGPLQAIEIAKKSGYPLIMAGKVNSFEREYFNKTLRPLINGKQIKFIGEVMHGQKVTLLKNARALLSPLQWDEPFGLTNIEALACGTPVIGVKRGSLPEIIQDGVTGYLCTSTAEMVRRIDVIEKLDRTACRMQVEKHFTSLTMTRSYIQAYQKVISKK